MDNPVTETVYEFVCSYLKDHGYPPSEREIAKACYLAQSSVHQHIKTLIKEGRLCYTPGKYRSLTIAEPNK